MEEPPDDRDDRVATLWAPARLRDALAAILAFDREQQRIVAVVGEPLLAEIRLAWWRERLTELACGASPPAEPLLQALAAARDRHRALDLARLSLLEDSFLPLLAGSVPDLAALARARGNILAGAILALDGTARDGTALSGAAAEAGARIALARFLRGRAEARMASAVERWLGTAPAPFETGAAPPRILAPLDRLAMADIAAARAGRPPAPAGHPARQLRIAAAALGLPYRRRRW